MSEPIKIESLVSIQISDTLIDNVNILLDLEKLLMLISNELKVLAKKEKVVIKELRVTLSKGVLNLLLDLEDGRTFTQLLSSHDT